MAKRAYLDQGSLGGLGQTYTLVWSWRLGARCWRCGGVVAWRMRFRHTCG